MDDRAKEAERDLVVAAICVGAGAMLIVAGLVLMVARLLA